MRSPIRTSRLDELAGKMLCRKVHARMRPKLVRHGLFAFALLASVVPAFAQSAQPSPQAGTQSSPQAAPTTPTSTIERAPASPYHLALAAGYKALTLCSGQFNGGRFADAIEQDELARIYPELRPYIDKLVARSDAGEKQVSVEFASGLPPRIAAWRPILGCSLLPIGADPTRVRDLPKVNVKAPNFDNRPWPLGDQNALSDSPRIARARLNVPVNSAFDRRTYGLGTETMGVVVVRNGRIVSEKYRLGIDQNTALRTWSVAKTIAGVLLGIAQDRKQVAIKSPVPFTEWQRPGDPRAKITLENLLRMASGLYSDVGNRTDAIYFGGASVPEAALGYTLQAAPGTHWEYANDDSLLAVLAMRRTMNDDNYYLKFPYEALFWRIGMTRTVAETDWTGNYVLSSQVYSTARDLSRFGLMLLNQGRFLNQQIVSAAYIQAMITPGPAQPEGNNRPGYGMQTWLFGAAQGLPAGSFAAQGNRGQYILVVPSEALVIVRTGLDAVGDGQPFDIARFGGDVIAALR